MAKLVPSLYATGCLQCPLRAESYAAALLPSPHSVGGSSSRVDPFLMFHDLRYGYFSLTMGVPYVPFPPGIDHHSYIAITTEITPASLGLLMAIFFHEVVGHKPQGETLPAYCMRFLAGLAYEALWQVMHSGSMEDWSKLQQLNQWIHELETATAFSSELFATLSGFQEMRYNEGWNTASNLSPKDLSRPKPERLPKRPSWNTASNLSPKDLDALEEEAIEALARNFNRNKDEISKWYRQLARVGDGCLSYLSIYIQDFVELREGSLKIVCADPIQRTASEGRLIEAVHMLALAGDSVVEMPADRWPGFFQRHLPGVTKSIRQFEETSAFLKKALKRVEERLAEKGVDNNGISFCPEPLGVLPTEPLIVSGGLGPEIVFTHLKTNTNSKPLLVPCFIGLSKGSVEKVVYASVAALILFETLRVMAANGYLTGCPMRWIPWAGREDGECCGLQDQLMRLWETGKKAGLPEETWRKPIDCPL